MVGPSDLPWVILGVSILAYFTFFEGYAFRHPDRLHTLSRTIYYLGQKWPLSIFLWGLLVGGLAVHFFWHFCPPGSVSGG